jgi:hypothetical protein
LIAVDWSVAVGWRVTRCLWQGALLPRSGGMSPKLVTGAHTVNGPALSRRFGTPSRPWLTHTASICRHLGSSLRTDLTRRPQLEAAMSFRFPASQQDAAQHMYRASPVTTLARWVDWGSVFWISTTL